MLSINNKMSQFFNAIINNDLAELERLWDADEINLNEYFAESKIQYLNSVGVAAFYGHLDIMKWLVNKGGPVDEVSNFGKGALYFAASEGHDAIVKWLVEEQDVLVTSQQKGMHDVFIETAAKGHGEILNYLLVNGANPNTAKSEDALSKAAKGFHVEICQFLLDYEKTSGIEYDRRCLYDKNLMIRAMAASLKMVQWLVNQGVKISSIDYEYINAIRYGRKELAEWLLTQGVSNDAIMRAYSEPPAEPIIYASIEAPKPVSFCQAIEMEDIDSVKTFVEAGADVNQKEDDLPIVTAIDKGNSEIIKYLVMHGPDVNAKAWNGMTILMYVMQPMKVTLELVQYLVGHGADIDAVYSRKPGDPKAYTTSVFKEAAMHGRFQIFKWLLLQKNEKADAIIRDPAILEKAVFSGHIRMVQWLVEHGAEVSFSPLPLLTTALHHFSMLKYLVEQGAKIDACDVFGMTALMHACAQGYYRTVQYLLENGADLNLQDKQGNTALHHAVKGHTGHPKIVKLLISYGVDVDAINRKGKTPLMYAAYARFYTMVQLLIHHGADTTICDSEGKTALTYSLTRFKFNCFVLDSVPASFCINTTAMIIANNAVINPNDWNALRFAISEGGSKRHYSKVIGTMAACSDIPQALLKLIFSDVILQTALKDGMKAVTLMKRSHAMGAYAFFHSKLTRESAQASLTLE